MRNCRPRCPAVPPISHRCARASCSCARHGMLALLHTGLSLVDPSPAAAAQLLGVKLGSLDRATVRLAYRRAAARSHPDVSEAPDAGELFADVTTAAQVLRTYLDQSRSATAAAARRARWSESEQESETAAAARARWTEYWKAVLSLPPLESTLGQQRVQLVELQQRHEHTCQVSERHAGVAQAWPDSALTSALATLLQQARTHARTLRRAHAMRTPGIRPSPCAHDAHGPRPSAAGGAARGDDRAAAGRHARARAAAGEATRAPRLALSDP